MRDFEIVIPKFLRNFWNLYEIPVIRVLSLWDSLGMPKFKMRYPAQVPTRHMY